MLKLLANIIAIIFFIMVCIPFAIIMQIIIELIYLSKILKAWLR